MIERPPAPGACSLVVLGPPAERGGPDKVQRLTPKSRLQRKPQNQTDIFKSGASRLLIEQSGLYQGAAMGTLSALDRLEPSGPSQALCFRALAKTRRLRRAASRPAATRGWPRKRPWLVA